MGVTVRTTALELTTSTGPREVPMRNIRAISVVRQCVWARLRIQTNRGEARVSASIGHAAAAVAAAAAQRAQTAS